MEETNAHEKEKEKDEISKELEFKRLQRENKEAEEKAKPLSEGEINKIVEKYIDNFVERFSEWKKEHPYGTQSDFIDFKLGFKNITGSG